jgi:hypothetical protein
MFVGLLFRLSARCAIKFINLDDYDRTTVSLGSLRVDGLKISQLTRRISLM